MKVKIYKIVYTILLVVLTMVMIIYHVYAISYNSQAGLSIVLWNINSTYMAGDVVSIRANVTHGQGASYISRVTIKINKTLYPEDAIVLPPIPDPNEMQIVGEIPNGYVYEFNYTLPTGNPNNKGRWEIRVTAFDIRGKSKRVYRSFELVNSPPRWIVTVPNLWWQTNTFCFFNSTNYLIEPDGEDIAYILCNETSLLPEMHCFPWADPLTIVFASWANWEGEKQTELVASDYYGASSWSNRFNVKVGGTRPPGYIDCTFTYKDEKQKINTF
ncbi:MAG: hypothetical protein QXL88_00670 [Candidatus Pacearchaeota archaeon]